MAKKPEYDGIVPDAKNANRGTERGRYMVEASLRETGAGRSILTDKDGRIIAGNKTFEAASDIGLPVRIVETDGTELIAVKRTDLDLSDNTGTARKLAYYDNRASQVGLDFDPEIVFADMQNGLDLSSMFTDGELDELLEGIQPQGAEGDTEPEIDRAEELRVKWGVVSGQLWSLDSGKGHAHRLICGDCTDAATVARVMGGGKAQATITDPPYNVGFDYGDTTDDTKTPEQYTEWLKSWFVLARSITVGSVVVTPGMVSVPLWIADIERTHFILAWTKANNNSRNYIGKTSGFQCWEPILVYGKAVTTILRDVYDYPIRMQSDVGDLHPCPKPLDLWTKLVDDFAESGAIVYEPFSGSGTTLIGCENLSRRCRAVEISPGYVAVALERWHVHTGKTPVLLEA